MEHYFLVEHYPLGKENHYSSVFFHHSVYPDYMMLALHHYGQHMANIQKDGVLLALYSVDSMVFDAHITDSIRIAGTLHIDPGVTPLAVCTYGQCIFFNPDLKALYINTVGGTMNLPVAESPEIAVEAHCRKLFGQPTTATASLAQKQPITEAMVPATAAVSQPDEYFSAPLRYWITAVLAADPTATDE